MKPPEPALIERREADVEETRATFAGGRTRAGAEVRAAREAVASNERSLASARAAASQAHRVVDITTISFRAGASTNIEVIDAERTARDNDLAVAVAEDRLLRARLDAVEREKLDRYQRRYAEYVRVAKALQALSS